MGWMERKIRPMLAYSSDPFDSEEFIWEPKWDGTRTIAFVGEKLRLQNRRLIDFAYRYPELSKIKEDVEAKEAILDGEVVVLSQGKPDFRKLQMREHMGDELRIELLSQVMPATFMAFDLLYLDGKPLVDIPLEERKAKLMEIVRESPRILISRHVETYGKRYFEGIVRMGLEGAMAKRKLSTYQMGKRSRDWLKVKNLKTMDCVILGYTPGEGWHEQYFGALVLGAYKGDELVYVGRVGTGFDEETVKLMTDMLRKMETHEKAVELSEPFEVRWVRPELVCEVKFLELTHDLKLRAPSFMRLRDEKAPDECRIDEG